jgi:hypothetical protein
MFRYIRLFLLLNFLFRIDHIAYSQSASGIQIRGSIEDASGFPLTDAQIQILGHSSGLIYLHTGLREKSEFDFALKPIAEDDTLKLKVTLMGYQDTTVFIELKSSQTQYKMNIRLSLQIKEMEEVEIKMPPVWKRGDTTFFLADAFKDGDERKLRELIDNLPGFDISSSGRLTYQNKPIDKIKIDGEELFSEQIGMLLNSFPVHPVHTVQVLENQSENPLLKGLQDGDKVFLNLGLKKEVWTAGFGDAEAGYTTSNTHLASSVIFSLLRQLKLGYVGNWNRVGDTFQVGNHPNLTIEYDNSMGNMLLRGHNLNVIPHLERRYFARNHLLDHRIQSNLKWSERVRTKTSLDFTRDFLQQRSDQSQTLLDGSTLLQRLDTSRISSRPYVLKLHHQLTYQQAPDRAWDIVLDWQLDRSRSTRESRMLQKGDAYQLHEGLGQTMRNFNTKIHYTHRISEHTANRWGLNVERHWGKQQGIGHSQAWPTLFEAPSRNFTTLIQALSLDYTNLNLNWSHLQSKGNSRVTWTLRYKGEWMVHDNVLSLLDARQQEHWATDEALSEQRKLSRQEWVGGVNTRLFPESLWHPQVNVSLGVQQGHRMYPIPSKPFWLPYLFSQFSLSTPFKTTKWRGMASVNYQHRMAAMSQLVDRWMPDQLVGYRSVIGGEHVAQRSISGSYNLNYHSASFDQYSATILYSKQLSGTVTLPTYLGFLSLATDSLVQFGGDQWSLSQSSHFTSIALETVFKVNLQFNRSRFPLQLLDEIYYSDNRRAGITVSAKRQWGRKIFLEFYGVAGWSQLQAPPVLSNQIASHVGDFRLGAFHRWVIQRGIHVSFQGSYIHNNLWTSGQRSYMLLDAGAVYVLPNRPLSITFKANNLINQKYYYLNFNQSVQQTFQRIPLLSRQLLVSMRYEI